MFRLHLDSSPRYCDGLSRRSFLQLGVAGMASLGLADLARARASATERKNTSVILIWLDGGPSHMDTYDMKPDAPPSTAASGSRSSRACRASRSPSCSPSRRR